MPPPPTPASPPQMPNHNGATHTSHGDPLHDRHHLPSDPHLHGLRLALGSILAPKRPAMSRTASGSSSPAHHHPHSGTGTPSGSDGTPPPHSPATPHHTHLHPPPGAVHTHSPLIHAMGDGSVTPSPPPTPDALGPHATPAQRAEFLKTLQGKSAWDALIHGSWC
ncbi:hypothetical protein K488DRAFT_86786 [Vararia minispora EC-137]|uniref:Uncharacterized protein n=1 Tax=Vararia minispora EC-137 TaxID=1314806 RepID=A0ACB8QHY0_9AGAM|nr:hypothetical protein K488DRAFT_86786 [Vararia minispora EC-137]